MNKDNKVYISIDLHSNKSMIGYMNTNGQYLAQQQFQTTAMNLINQVAAIPAEAKHLTIEQGNQAFWAAELLSEHVDELIVCDPRHNRLITQSANKNDRLDTHRLCKLFRLGELKEVWRPKQLGRRRVFYGQIKEYQRLTKTLTAYKNQLQAALGDQRQAYTKRLPGAGEDIRPDRPAGACRGASRQVWIYPATAGSERSSI